GNVKNDPPPATVFMMPAAKNEAHSSRTEIKVITIVLSYSYWARFPRASCYNGISFPEHTMQTESTSTLRWLYIDFNSYFASVEQQLNPALRGKPIAVVPVETDATCAIAASYEAKAFGIRTGTPIYEAKRMCPGLMCVLGRHEKYTEFHHAACDEIN